jgi:hypothetical protein
MMRSPETEGSQCTSASPEKPPLSVALYTAMAARERLPNGYRLLRPLVIGRIEAGSKGARFGARATG